MGYDLLSHSAAVAFDHEQAEVWSLVLWAAAIPNAVRLRSEGWGIYVRQEQIDHARREIESYEEENRAWPPPPNAPSSAAPGTGRPPTVFFMGCLVLFHAWTGPWTDSNPWFNAGAISGRQILEHGEWWRLLTALTLHAGASHLLGNVLIGGFIVHFLCRTLGTGLGWFVLLASATAGNAVNVLIKGPLHNSVGFSTAVFAAIGLLVGHQGTVSGRLTLRGLFPPLAAGAALLAMLGSSGENTDYGAHFFGLATGSLAGILLGGLPFFRRLVDSARGQWLLGAASISAVIFCWRLAINS